MDKIMSENRVNSRIGYGNNSYLEDDKNGA
jgi:hypothetical protein